MKILRQSATATVTVGPVLDANGAAVTTAVVGDFRISKNGTPATLSGATVTHDANGYYTIALTTSNTDTVGRLEIYSGNTAQATAVHNWTVLLASVFDALQTNATNATGGLVTATAAVTAMAGAISTLTAGGVRTELATELGRIDTTVGSRLATASYTTPPSAATNATAVRTELATELGRIDVSVSSRSTLTAGGVRTELATELGRIDAAISSRMATFTVPANFAALGINSSGHVSRVTLVDTTTVNTDMRGTDNAALASAWTATRAGYLDSVLLAQNSNQRTVQVTGSNHVAADVHEMQMDVIDADAIAASAVTELQAGLATAANLLIVSDRVSYSLAVLVGACSDAQTAAETYTLTIGGNTFTVDYTGLDSSGNRSTTTLSKA